MNKKFFSVILLGAMLVTSMGTFTACKDYDGDISNVQSQVDANKKAVDEKIAALQAAATQATKDIADAKAQAVAAKTAADAAAAAAAKANTAAEKAAADAAAAKAAADAAKAAGLEAAATAKADAIAEAQKLVNALKLTVDGKVDQTVFDTKMGDITAKLNAITGRLEKAEEAIEAYKLQIAALENYKKELEKLGLTEKVGKIDQLVADMENLIKKGGTIDVIKEDITRINDRITNEINPAISTLDQVISGRLTSLTFVPSTFISGIEAVEFKTLTYKPWTKLLADATDGTTDITINDGSTTAYYYVNPSSVKVDDLKNLSALVNIATNTKADAPAQIKAAFKSYENGKLAVSLTKTSAAPLNFDAVLPTEKFNLMALKAEIKLTAEETAAGLKPTVVSDWARLSETPSTPYIHNADFTTCPREDLDGTSIPHFYPYNKIHPKEQNADQKNPGFGIVRQVAYNDHSLDLDALVKVCGKDGKFITNFADYNLKFEFNLVEYGLITDNDPVVVEITDQAKFAHIDAENIIHSNAYGNVDLTDNRDAIGREPLVQVILRDTEHNKVVDVRYFKIKWVLVTEKKDLGILAEKEDTYKCTSPVTGKVGTEAMNVKVYTAMNMSKEVFHNAYKLDSKAYTFDNVVTGATSIDWASVEEISSGTGTATTYNVAWTIDLIKAKITPSEYSATYATRDIYGRYIAKDNSGSVLYFKLATKINIPQMAFAAGYDQGYWNVSGAELSNTNAAKEFRVNPALTSDENYGTVKSFTDCRIIANMLKGYNKTGVVLSNPLELVSGAKQARLEFNKEALSVLPVVSGKIWKVENDATTSKLILGTEIAAVITFADNTIELYEGATPGKTGAPTAAAQLLLGNIVPVRLVAGLCNDLTSSELIEVVLDQFNVRFISPLKLNLSTPTESFKDLLTGGSIVKIDELVNVKEAFGLERLVWEGTKAKDADLATWYIVKGIVWNLDEAKTNMKLDGNNITITSDDLASDFSLFNNKYKITATPGNTNATALTFVNNSGASIQQAFTVSVPVYAITKWSPMLVSKTSKYVTFTVQPGTVSNAARR